MGEASFSSVGSVQPNSFTQDAVVNLYDLWGLRITYDWDEGTAQLPVAAPAGVAGALPRPPCRIIKVNAPIGSVTVEWTAKRVGKLPILPSPIPRDSNYVLKTAQIATHAPALEGDGNNREIEVSGTYFYYLKVPIWMLDGAGLLMGATPYDTNPIQANALSPGQFVQGLF